MFVPFDPQPPAADLPEVFPTPFRPGPPHPLAQRAARETQAYLHAHPWVTPEMFAGEHGGKMVGVLVVRDANDRVGYLRGFAGMMSGRWEVGGFVPPAFDLAEFERIWSAGSEKIVAFDEQLANLRSSASSDGVTASRLRDTTEAQKQLSRGLYADLQETYRISNARGESTKLRALFEPRMPPGGAGDCAGPKLFARAFAVGARPVAMAEFWWGAPPPGGGRQAGVFYPACRGRCAKILPFMLEGLDCEPAPDFGIEQVPDDAPVVVHEDDAIIVVDKPAGLLSVRGRGPRRQDSVELRLLGRFNLDDETDPTWPRLVHRLDLATSGLLVAAKYKQVYVALQRKFSERKVEKRYVALLHGSLSGAGGVIDLPLGRDLDDRPRQMHDAVKGKQALTRWESLGAEGDTTRVALYPQTGRTHQLRVHAAHAKGLGSPIVGDWIYGFGGDRLMLHAESIAFEHPVTGEPMAFRSACPF